MKRGPKKLDEKEKRIHTVSVRLNDNELKKLDERRLLSKMQRGEYLRVVSLKKVPHVIPKINQDAWVELSRAASNLNQIAYKLNSIDIDVINDLSDLKEKLKIFRRVLLDMRLEDES